MAQKPKPKNARKGITQSILDVRELREGEMPPYARSGDGSRNDAEARSMDPNTMGPIKGPMDRSIFLNADD